MRDFRSTIPEALRGNPKEKMNDTGGY